MLLDTTGKDFTPVTLLTADRTPQRYLLPGEWSAARGASCSSRLFASTQMDVLYMTLNSSNMGSAWYKPIPSPPSSLPFEERGRVSCPIHLINLTSYNQLFFHSRGVVELLVTCTLKNKDNVVYICILKLAIM